MIYIANKTREIEKDNNNLGIKILKINEDIKINRIELTTHQNSNYLKKLYSLYFHDLEKNNISNVVSLKYQLKNSKKIELVKTKN